ncbi:ABC transporter ATP-binding protein [Candidatus Contubernalis alkaliaceticus]|uniref:ABC transporter ATP-binding protein n=1 Tax=Candidatus Contubernalis alkaliaceticus TaxID=338645 RepID=UPI001F4C2A14|nr:ABC transporter ATP-binding protein [Candidatus Contubernalis alkalaceticus]UNC91968.1 ABC transporter ATP-binding protein [Candidatus Contubernalis alkalaceticus]
MEEEVLILQEIAINNVTKIYPMGNTKVYALKDINTSIEKGDLTCLLGPSGSGKSTLLYLLGGLESSSEGCITVGNTEITRLDQNQLSLFRRNHVGFIFQSFNLLPQYNALENVEIPLFFARVSKKERRKRAIEVLELVGLSDRMTHKPSELSGGQQQRVSIARALVTEPPIILADEPTGNLDTKTGEEIVKILVKMNQERKKTIVIATHDIEVAEFAHKVIYLRDGQVQKIEEVS